MNSPVDQLLPEGLASPRETWELAFFEGLAPDPDLMVWEWADQRRFLPTETSAEPGPWRTERTPFLREIMEALSPSDPTQEVIFAKGTQLGGTEVGNNFLGFVMDVAPGPVMMVLPTSNTGKRSSRTRIDKMIESTPVLRDKVAEKRSRDSANSMTLKDFPGGILIVAGANSASELSSSPVRYLFLDELDSFPDFLPGEGPPEKLAEKRTDTFVRKKIFKVSSVKGSKNQSKIWKNFLRSDQRRPYVPCPHCEHEQVLVWEQMRWETRRVRDLKCKHCGGITEMAAAADAYTCSHCHEVTAAADADTIERDTREVLWAHYECVACGEAIEEHHKEQMFARGRWIAEAPGVGKPKGYHLSSLYSPLGWYSWLSAARDYVLAEDDPSGELMRTFTNTVCGLEYKEPGAEIELDGLRTRAEPYKLRTVPMGGLMLAAGVDVQKNRLEVKVKAYGRGEESWLIAYEQIFGDPMQDDVWESLDEFLQVAFPHESGNSMRVLATAVDSGYLTQRVYAFCAARLHRLVFPVKGIDTTGKAVLGKPSKQDVDWQGRVLKDGIDLWPVGVDTAKTMIHNRLMVSLPGPQYMHFPLGLPDSYYKGLTAERQVRKFVRGYLRMTWEKDAGVANEPLDLEVYAYAAAIRAGLTRANWDKLEAFFRATGDLFVAATRQEATRAASEGGQQDADVDSDVATIERAEEGRDANGTAPVPPASAADAEGAQRENAATPASAPPEPARSNASPKKAAWIQPRRDWFGRGR